MRTFIFLFISILVLGCNSFSQSIFAPNSGIGKYYWTKFVLATEGDCKVEITPNDISPNKKYCKFLTHLETNSKIKLKKIKYQRNWAKLTFIAENDYEITVFLKNNSKRNFQKSFDLAFSKELISEKNIGPSCDVKTKLDVIRKIGFPSIIQRMEKTETWTLDVNWIGGLPCGFDITNIEIKNGIVTSISGII